MMLLSLKNVTRQRENGATYCLLVRALSVGPGELVAITGPSGCGKSTTLDLLGMVLCPDRAERFVTFLNGTSVDIARLWEEGRTADLTAIRRSHLGYVLQTGELFPFLRVEENIVLTALVAGVPRSEALVRAKVLLERLELSPLRRAWPENLSVGQRQRVAIARALAPRPGLLLADEPTAALDPGLSRKVMKLLLEIVQELHTAVVMVSHDVDLVHEFAFREIPVVMHSRDERTLAVLDDGTGGA